MEFGDSSALRSDFLPTKLLLLSELSTREKERYYQLLLLNNAKFKRLPDGRFVASLRLLAPGIRKLDPTLEKQRKKKDMSNYALIFQERLTILRQEGYIQVNLVGIDPNAFQYNMYPRFTALIAFRGETVKPRLRPLSWVMKLVEDIYDNRFAHEKHDVEREDDAPSFDLILLIFPVFVVRRLGTNVGLKSIVDQTCWDLLYCTHVYRRDYLELEIFARFLQEFYDHDDLLFYLYVRSVIAKVLHFSFKSRWQKLDAPGRQPRNMWMTYREAAHVAKIVFGNENEDMYRDFMALITPQMEGERTEVADSRRIDITEYLHLSVVGYHQSQSRHLGGGERLLVPIPGQTLPPQPVPQPLAIDDYDFSSINRRPSTRTADSKELEREEVSQSRSDSNKDFLAAPAFDLEAEERGFEAEYKAHNSRRGDKGYGEDAAFNAVKSLPMAQALQRQESMNKQKIPMHMALKQQEAAQVAQAAANSGFSADDLEMLGLLGSDDIGASDDNFDFGGLQLRDLEQSNAESELKGAMQEQQYEENDTEDLQHAREMEFIQQLMASLSEAPSDVYEYVEAEVFDRLHRTVSMLLSDKSAEDPDSLDAALLDILQLDQLRVDMEELRDSVLASLMPDEDN